MDEEYLFARGQSELTGEARAAAVANGGCTAVANGRVQRGQIDNPYALTRRDARRYDKENEHAEACVRSMKTYTRVDERGARSSRDERRRAARPV